MAGSKFKYGDENAALFAFDMSNLSCIFILLNNLKKVNFQIKSYDGNYNSKQNKKKVFYINDLVNSK